MSFPSGRAALQRLRTFESRHWYTKDLKTLVEAIVAAFSLRNEVIAHVAVAEGATLAAGALHLDVGSIPAVLHGRHKAASAADSDVDYLTAAGTVGVPIFEDGASAEALLLASDEGAYCTLITTNSDSAGGVNDADGDPMDSVVVVKGTAATYAAQTRHLTSLEVQTALEASTAHNGTTGWAHIAQILFDNPAGTPGTAIVPNLNNRLGV